MLMSIRVGLVNHAVSFVPMSVAWTCCEGREIAMVRNLSLAINGGVSTEVSRFARCTKM